MTPWAEFAPDRFQTGTPVAAAVRGVLPAPDGYGPWPAFVAGSVALPATCQGAVSVFDSNNSVKMFAATATKIYKYVGPTDNWTDVTRSSGGNYTLPNDTLWSRTQWGSDLIMAEQNDAIQYIDITSGTNFAPLGGSPPQSGFVKAVGEFIFALDQLDDPNRLSWSARNNPQSWTYGYQDSEFYDFPGEYGVCRACTDLRGGLVFQDHAIHAFAPENSRRVFVFTTVNTNIGLLSTDSLVTVGQVSFFYADSGFYAIAPNGEVKAIGANRVNDWFRSRVNSDRQYAIRGVRDPTRNRVIWIYPLSGNNSNYFEEALCYDLDLDRWTYAPVDVSVMFEAASPGWTTDTIDNLFTAQGYSNLDEVPYSLDARWLAGGQPYLGAFGSDNKFATMTGDPIAATLETMDFQPVPDARARITAIWPIDDTSAGTVAIGARETVNGSNTFGSTATIDSKGAAYLRSSGRYHRVRRSIPAGTTWTHAAGINIEAHRDGFR